MIKHVYIHIPFCTKKCSYCSFYSIVYQESVVKQYLKKLHDEIDFYHSKYCILPETIYFGGGTPSLLKPDDLYSIVKKFDTSQTVEITIEANPSTVTISDLKYMNELGINRLSLGVQSMCDHELKLLDRTHRANDVISLYEKGLKDIFSNVSFDFVYGLPSRKKSFQSILYTASDSIYKSIMCFQPEHISVYCLSLEENVPLYKQKNNIPADEIVSDMYFCIRDVLIQNNFEQYELSSFCRNSKVSRHNLCYWSSKSYVGIGAGSSGYINNFRYKNHYLKNYMSSSSHEEHASGYVKDMICLSDTDIEKEYIITGLRRTSGISIKDFDHRFECSFLEKHKETINKLLNKGLIEVLHDCSPECLYLAEYGYKEGTYLRIKTESYFIANEVLCEFL